MSFPKNIDVSRLSGTFYPRGSGPKTPQGKAISARNATTHGLFARDVVLPTLGEDPAGYETLFLELSQQIDPRNLVEHHYVEQIAAASWRLRRLHRWQAQVYEDLTLTEDERLDKLDRVLRHETALHRQIDKSVRLLGREVPQLFEGRARKAALAELGQTERSCRLDERVEGEVSELTRENLQFAPTLRDFDRATLDNARAEQTEQAGAEAPAQTEKCQNELPSPAEAEEAGAEAAPPRTAGPNQRRKGFSRTISPRLAASPAPKKKPKRSRLEPFGLFLSPAGAL